MLGGRGGVTAATRTSLSCRDHREATSAAIKLFLVRHAPRCHPPGGKVPPTPICSHVIHRKTLVISRLTRPPLETLTGGTTTPTTKQVQFSLISRFPLENGLLETAKSLGVTSIAYSPLGLGLLTGKYHAGNIPSGPRGIIFRRVLPTMGPLLAVLEEIATARDKTMSQVALNWCVCKGTVPIVGIKTLAQARENLGALGWLLSPAEVEGLDRGAARIEKQSVQNIFQST